MSNTLDEHTETPPEDLWDDLQKTLFPEEENKTIIVPLVQKNEKENHVHKNQILIGVVPLQFFYCL